MEEESQKNTVIKIRNLYKRFGDNAVLNGFDMDLYEGENLVIMGKSGSGKSVMIKCLIGLEEHDSGSIQVMGKEIDDLDADELDELRTEIGFLFQGSALYDSMSVRENLEFPLRRHTKKFGKITDAEPLVLEALESVGLQTQNCPGAHIDFKAQNHLVRRAHHGFRPHYIQRNSTTYAIRAGAVQNIVHHHYPRCRLCPGYFQPDDPIDRWQKLCGGHL